VNPLRAFFESICTADRQENTAGFVQNNWQRKRTQVMSSLTWSGRAILFCACTAFALTAAGADKAPHWPSFRGHDSRGVADGYPVRSSWSADPSVEKVGVLWSTPVPGLGHSSPIVWGDKLFLATAISTDGKAPLKIGRGGRPEAADDHGEQSWVVLCYDRLTGGELWRKTAHRGRPRATRHAKATHANTSLVTDGKHLVAFFGSEGLYCYDLNGKLLWKRDLGVINISKYGIGWGYASSPAIHNDRIALVCDDPKNPFLVVLRLSDGQEMWRASRAGICERSWGTPFIHKTPERTQVVINGWPWIVSYDLHTAKELWRIRGGGDNPVPTPFEANGWIYITSSHGGQSPIYVVRPNANGDISPAEATSENDAIVWSTTRGGSYMSTPVVYRGHLYLGYRNIIRCFDAKTGKLNYEERLPPGASIISSLVAADGKVFCASENGTVYVLAAGADFNILSRNKMGNACFASPAISQGMLYFRTTENLVAVQ
jgi:outer membrane protein assembly factor BamB